MSTTKIYATAVNTVEMITDDPFGGETPIAREFRVPMSGGYVREGSQQVCEGLARLGLTLSVNEPEELLQLIRREHRRSQAAERRAERNDARR